MRTLIMVLLAWLTASALAAQAPKPVNPTRRISLVVSGGSTMGGPAAGLESELRTAGYTYVLPAVCMFICPDPVPGPYRRGPRSSRTWSARYAFNGQVAIGGGYSTASLGGATGYRKDREFNLAADYVQSVWGNQAVWLAVFYTPSPTLRIGTGPASYRIEMEGKADTRKLLTGWMGEVGLTLPGSRRFFVDLAVRFNLVPPTTVPHNTKRVFLYGPPDVQAVAAPVLMLHPYWSYTTLQAGLGVHL